MKNLIKCVTNFTKISKKRNQPGKINRVKQYKCDKVKP